MLAAVAFAVLPVRIKELVYGNVQQGDDLVKGVQARMLAPVLKIHDGTRGIDCAPMIHGYLREIDDLVATKELQIHLAIQSPAFINGNKLLIEKVFSNLISNAVKYSPHGASVDIILQNTNGRFLFSVENTGTHIPEDDIPKLFDAFYRMEQSRSRRTGGSGLGLYMVQRILQQHNSYCEACNTENGVKFFFTI